VTLHAGEVLDEAGAAGLLPERDPRGHKGMSGRVVVVAGSLDYAGAALMSGAAALRAGCGLVSVCVPASLQPHITGRVPELITRGLPETAPFEIDASAAAADVADLPHDALLLGPGLKPGRGTTRLVQLLLGQGEAPAVVDAGALDALAGIPGWWERLARSSVLTPHPGEFARLGHEVADEDTARRDAATEAAAAWGTVVVLKGAGTVISAPDGRTRTSPFDVPALASAGTGDVLAGVIVSLLGQGLAPFDAAALGVYMHARAGEDVSTHLGDAGLMATDLLTAIPRVRRHLDAVRRTMRGTRLGFDAPAGGRV
jgi:NAD(P)H-hydrate epimerase